MEIVGIIDELRENGLHHAPTTQTRRSPPMLVKLQFVICTDDGQEATITDVGSVSNVEVKTWTALRYTA